MMHKNGAILTSMLGVAVLALVCSCDASVSVATFWLGGQCGVGTPVVRTHFCIQHALTTFLEERLVYYFSLWTPSGISELWGLRL